MSAYLHVISGHWGVIVLSAVPVATVYLGIWRHRRWYERHPGQNEYFANPDDELDALGE